MRQLRITKQITQRDTVSLNKYLTEVSSISGGGLSAEEEAEIAFELRNTKDPKREKELIDKMVLGNLRFVISVAKQYRNSTSKLDLNDLINAGNLGMVKAAMRFDETRGFKFISYAVWWIRQSILQEISDVGDVVRKPLNKIGLFSKVKKIQAELEQHLERMPTSEEIAIELGAMDDKHGHLTQKDIDQLFAVNKYAFSIDSYTNQSDSDVRFVDNMDSNGLEDLEGLMNVSDLKVEIEKHLKMMPNKEQLVIRGFYGIGISSPKSLSEIGDDMGLTRERCRQIKQKAIRRLKSLSKKGILEQYL